MVTERALLARVSGTLSPIPLAATRIAAQMAANLPRWFQDDPQSQWCCPKTVTLGRCDRA
jgi:hypothetical protein